MKICSRRSVVDLSQNLSDGDSRVSKQWPPHGTTPRSLSVPRGCRGFPCAPARSEPPHPIAPKLRGRAGRCMTATSTLQLQHLSQPPRPADSFVPTKQIFSLPRRGPAIAPQSTGEMWRTKAAGLGGLLPGSSFATSATSKAMTWSELPTSVVSVDINACCRAGSRTRPLERRRT